MIGRVSRLYCDQAVSNEMLWRNPDIEQYVTDLLQHAFRDAAYPLAVEVRPCDVVVERLPALDDMTRNLTRFRGRWAPSTDEVELAGGPSDGEVVALAGAPKWEPYRVPVAVDTSASLMADADPFAPTYTIVEYRMAGWDERGRWIYRAD